MKSIRALLGIMSFALAIGCAFASHFRTSVDGYSHLVDVPDQEIQCKFRKTCSDVIGPICRASFLAGGEQYNNVALYKLDGPVCAVVIYEP